MSIKKLLLPNYTLQDQFIIAGFWICFWALFFEIMKPILINFFQNKKWFQVVKETAWKLEAGETLSKKMKLGKEQYIQEVLIPNWVEDKLIHFQHVITAILITPSVFGLFKDKELNYALADVGMLSETGWEIYHLLKLIYLKKTARKELQGMITFNLIMMIFHHSGAILLVIPLNMYYPREYYYHLLGWLLEAWNWQIMLGIECGRTLDLTKKRDFLCFNILNVCLTIYILFIRIIFYGYVALNLHQVIKNDNDKYGIQTLSNIVLCMFSLFNIFFMTLISYRTVYFIFYYKNKNNKSKTEEENNGEVLKSTIDTEFTQDTISCNNKLLNKE